MDVSPHSMTSHFLCWEGAQNQIFCMKDESYVENKWQGVDHEGSYILSEASMIIFLHIRKDIKHPSSNGCLSLQYSILFSMLKGCPKSDLFIKFVSYFLAEMTLCGLWGDHIDWQKHFQLLLYLFERLWSIQPGMDVAPYSTSSHFPVLGGCQKSYYLSWNLGVVLGRNDTMCATMAHVCYQKHIW